MGKDVCDLSANALSNAATGPIQGVRTKGTSKKWTVPSRQVLTNGPRTARAERSEQAFVRDPNAALGKLKEASVGKMNDATVGKAKQAGEGARSDTGGPAKDGVADSTPGGGLLKGKSGGVNGAGTARRMPAHLSTDIGAPLTTAYDQFTHFEEWTDFMHRVHSVSQGHERHLSFKDKTGTRTREFTAESTGQRPGEWIECKVTEDISHTGAVIFHELSPHLTRVEVSLDRSPSTSGSRS